MSKLRIAIAVVVSVIWATGYIIAFFDRTFDPDASVSGIMLAVVTWLFAPAVTAAAKKKFNDITGKDDNNG